ncbi:MAG: Stp1/IreP family PP2C-type Ser/Thr phosphatase [Pseudomonadales bacterium]|nr:Stp1/IreP family PP2C-type Ser/Thr phosphatase [Pseudomonadales bacterium]
MNLKGKIQIVCQTDVGQIREHNEDSLSGEEQIGLAVLADGMGGLNAGEVASSMTVHLLMDDLREYQTGNTQIELELPDSNENLPLPIRVLKHAIEKANNAVFHVSQTQPQCQGMGTTVVASLFYENKVAVGHIGDSRMYRYRDGKIEQLTKDHSYVQELLDKGLYTAEEARSSAKKNVVTRAVGIAPSVEAEVNEYKVKIGDIYLMCSDGLTDLVRDQDIAASIKELGDNLGETASHLIDVANASGGKDNISVVLTKILNSYSAKGGILKRIANWFE